MAIKPLIHRIIVKQQKLEETDKDYIRASKAGIIIPDHDDNKRAQAGVDKGVVVSIGPTAYRDFGIESPLQIGDIVVFAKFSGKTIADPKDNEEYVALNDEDIIAIINGE
jgi:co-chaperonin GroES (HSP10)